MFAATTLHGESCSHPNAKERAGGAVFHVTPLGRLANQMIQYMVALKFAARVPGCRISNVNLPEWDIVLPTIAGDGARLTWTDAHRIDMDTLSRRMKAGEIRHLRYEGFGHRMENLLDRTQYRDVFRAPLHRGVGFGSGHLLCHVRAGDILSAEHPGYVMTPVEFYQEIVARTGLVPVLMGETGPSDYLDRLRAALPQAIVLPKGDIIRDFETIRQSKNIVVSCSSFCWLAAWLSDAGQIFMPVNGMLNPLQDHRINLLPLGDPRYRFFLFPVNYAVPAAEHAGRHRAMAGLWREVPHQRLERLLAAAPRVPRRIEAFLPLFNETYYRARYRRTDTALADPRPGNALRHYREHGFGDGWRGFDIDDAWYTERYPVAAFEIGHGDYDDASHHYAEIGHLRGYRPVAPLHRRWSRIVTRKSRRLIAKIERRSRIGWPVAGWLRAALPNVQSVAKS